MTEQGQTPAGWFPQPDGRQRYWDGSAWTEHYAAGQAAQSQAGPAAPAASGPPARKKPRIFLWVFLVVQVLFIIWIVVGVSGNSSDAIDCGTLSQQACNDVRDVGTGIGVFIIVVVWIIVDFLMGLVYGIYRLAKRT